MTEVLNGVRNFNGKEALLTYDLKYLFATIRVPRSQRGDEEALKEYTLIIPEELA